MVVKYLYNCVYNLFSYLNYFILYLFYIVFTYYF